MEDYFAFRTLVSPRLIQAVYVLGAVGIAVGALILFAQAGSSQTCDQFGNCAGTSPGVYVLLGIVALTLGELFWRITCESWIIFFAIHDRLRGLEGLARGDSPTPSTAPVAPGPGSAPGLAARTDRAWGQTSAVPGWPPSSGTETAVTRAASKDGWEYQDLVIPLGITAASSMFTTAANKAEKRAEEIIRPQVLAAAEQGWQATANTDFSFLYSNGFVESETDSGGVMHFHTARIRVRRLSP